MTTNNLFRLATGAVIALGISTAALAQTTDGGIQGTVLDPSGALIPQAQVTVSDTNGFSRTIKTDEGGNFSVAHLAPGAYSISIIANGFTPTLGEVRVANHTMTQENVKLGISVNQEIEVLAN